MGVFGVGLETHEVHNVHDPNLQIGHLPAKDVHRGECLEGGDVPTASHHHVRLLTVVVAGPLPDSDASRAVQDGVVHRQVVQGGLLPGNDDVDVVPAPQAVVGHR